MARFEYVDHEREQGLALYFEDECIALDTWDRKRGPGDHEILLDPRAVELIIETLIEMQSDIRSRYQKAITA
ncbi:hypothetical protein ACFFGR_09490 [Arthrobacter liuii]|uniref:Uncharacterized protein n=1 Tax=Arthrobacter liuii TaxID=1476996 RepID=A0ABQ2AMP0_9MICC|nr:hypothetical protein [Arthrobacter liuii]GGH93940.1 hypothetical protein GCM10007170_15980 [Arthrobacter liuii]